MNNLIKQIIESRFNFNIDIESNVENNENDHSLFSRSKHISNSLKNLYEEYQWIVDLELPSGTRWCAYNLGCDFKKLFYNPEITKPEDWYGDYYAWGETSLSNKFIEGYTLKTYKYIKYLENKDKLTKYCNDPKEGYKEYVDDLTQLLLEDDAAYLYLHVNDFNFCIPTKEQFKELLKYTTYKLIKRYKDIAGLYGILFTSKKNDNSIFIPLSGSRAGGPLLNSDGQIMEIWTANIDEKRPYNAYTFYQYGVDSVKVNVSKRFYGLPIRPVLYAK